MIVCLYQLGSSITLTQGRARCQDVARPMEQPGPEARRGHPRSVCHPSCRGSLPLNACHCREGEVTSDGWRWVVTNSDFLWHKSWKYLIWAFVNSISTYRMNTYFCQIILTWQIYAVNILSYVYTQQAIFWGSCSIPFLMAKEVNQRLNKNMKKCCTYKD